jgi:tetratricopeptide (TPR) repeat protein
MKLKPDYIGAHVNLGAAYYNLGRMDEAIEAYKKVITLAPDSIEAHYNLGLVYTDKGLRNKAIMEFEETLKIRPDHIEALKMLESLSR